VHGGKGHPQIPPISTDWERREKDETTEDTESTARRPGGFPKAYLRASVCICGFIPVFDPWNLRNLWMHSAPTRPHLTTGGEPAEGMGLPPCSAAEKAAFRCRRAWRENPPGPYATWACAGQGYRLTWTRTAKRTGSPGRARGNGASNSGVLGRLPDGTAMTSWALQRPSWGEFVVGSS